MKQTEVGWIPGDWELVRIGDSFSFKNGLNKEKQFFGYGYPIVNYMDVFNHPSIIVSKLKGRVFLNSSELKSFEILDGDVLFTRTSETQNEIGISSVVFESSENTVFSGFLLRARPFNSKFTIEFCKYSFASGAVRKQVISKSSYTTRALTNGRLLSEVVVPLPPLPEQQAIATALGDTDAWIESLEKLLVKKSLIKQGAMQQLLNPKKGWDLKKLGEVCDIYTGKSNNQDKVENGIYPFFVRSQTIERINHYSFDGEAILIPGEGGIGSIFHYINGKFNFHQRVYKLSGFTNVSGKFIYWYLKKYFGFHAMQNSVKATVDSLRLPTFLNFEISLPLLSEQTRIAIILSDMDSEIESLESKLAKAKKIKKGMMQVLLTGKVRLV